MYSDISSPASYGFVAMQPTILSGTIKRSKTKVTPTSSNRTARSHSGGKGGESPSRSGGSSGVMRNTTAGGTSKSSRRKSEQPPVRSKTYPHPKTSNSSNYISAIPVHQGEPIDISGNYMPIAHDYNQKLGKSIRSSVSPANSNTNYSVVEMQKPRSESSAESAYSSMLDSKPTPPMSVGSPPGGGFGGYSSMLDAKLTHASTAPKITPVPVVKTVQTSPVPRHQGYMNAVGSIPIKPQPQPQAQPQHHLHHSFAHVVAHGPSQLQRSSPMYTHEPDSVHHKKSQRLADVAPGYVSIDAKPQQMHNSNPHFHAATQQQHNAYTSMLDGSKISPHSHQPHHAHANSFPQNPIRSNANVGVGAGYTSMVNSFPVRSDSSPLLSPNHLAPRSPLNKESKSRIQHESMGGYVSTVGPNDSLHKESGNKSSGHQPIRNTHQEAPGYLTDESHVIKSHQEAPGYCNAFTTGDEAPEVNTHADVGPGYEFIGSQYKIDESTLRHSFTQKKF